MGKLRLVFVIVFLSLVVSSYARTLGKLKTHQQITDKQVLLETTDGSKILVSALENHAFSVKAVDDSEILRLIEPEAINNNVLLNGSIYIEELDELLQITTASNTGVVLRIERNPLSFTFIDKETNAVLLSEKNGINTNRKGQYIQYETEKDEEINVLKSTDTNFWPDNESACIITSSKGYGLFLNDHNPKQVEKIKDNQLNVEIENNNGIHLDYVFIIGGTELELMTRFAALNYSSTNIHYTLK